MFEVGLVAPSAQQTDQIGIVRAYSMKVGIFAYCPRPTPSYGGTGDVVDCTFTRVEGVWGFSRLPCCETLFSSQNFFPTRNINTSINLISLTAYLSIPSDNDPGEMVLTNMNISYGYTHVSVFWRISLSHTNYRVPSSMDTPSSGTDS
jgi:hypothetical protein